ncbi:MAG: NUDIX hydrolase [Planctomycetales bacterium]|nr:NUDIX hydrolase [Planctomycetales bacterium]
MSNPPKILLECARFRVEEIEQPLDNGAVRRREVVRHPGSVVIVPVVDDERICLIRNERPTVGRTLIEFPAGTLEPEEDPRNAAFRELREETGFQADEMHHLLDFYPAPGILDERMSLYLATGLRAGPPAREPGEHIENLVVTGMQAQTLVQSGQIQDAKTLVGIYLYLTRPNGHQRNAE